MVKERAKIKRPSKKKKTWSRKAKPRSINLDGIDPGLEIGEEELRSLLMAAPGLQTAARKERTGS